MQLLPGQVHMFVPWQAVQRPCLNGMDDLLGRPFCRNEIKPPAGCELRMIQPQDVFRDRIASPEAVEQPSVELVLLQRLLQRFDICFVCHRHIISNVTAMPAFTQQACLIVLTNGRGGVQICTRRIKSEITEIAYDLSMFDFTQFGLDRSQGVLALTLRTSMIVDPPDGRLPPLSDEGKKMAAARAEARKRMGGQFDQVQNEPLSVRCIHMDRVGPPMLPGAYNNTYQIVQTPG